MGAAKGSAGVWLPVLNNLFTYLLAVIASRHGILVHAVEVMSTHIHIVLTDVRGCLPRFLQEFHRLLALTIKVLRMGRCGVGP